MVFRFLLLSDEVDNFKREIKIDSDATFADLQKAIVDSVGFKTGEMASFFICNDEWEKEQEITSIEMDTSSDEDSYVMSDTVLGDLLEEERQKLMFVFDYMTERAFYMEAREIILGQNLKEAVCSASTGNPPEQFIDFHEIETKTPSIESDENFYGDEGYDIDELDSEGFDGLDAPASPSEGEEGF